MVEDDVSIRTSLVDLLGDEGVTARPAGNGREALDLVRAVGAPALILLDLMMPEMDGAGFLELRRADPALAGVPVVIMTASQRAEVSQVQADGLLRKPFTISQLLATLEPWIAGQAG